MTAEDVVLNYQYHMNPDTASAAGGLLSQIETISCLLIANFIAIRTSKLSNGGTFNLIGAV